MAFTDVPIGNIILGAILVVIGVMLIRYSRKKRKQQGAPT